MPLDVVECPMRALYKMRNPENICEYYRHFVQRLCKDALPWARDNIFFACIMAVIPPLIAYLHDRTHPTDWTVIQTALWFYLAALLIYLGYHAIRTPWKLSLTATNNAPEPVISFKVEVLNLSVSVLDFVYERIQNAPPSRTRYFGSVGSANMLRELGEHIAQQAATKKYEAETLGIYEYKFARKITATVNALKERGLHDEAVEGLWANPANSEAIKIIGKRLGELADRVIEPENVFPGP